MMGAPIALPPRRNALIGSLRISLVDQHVAVLAMLGEVWRRRCGAGNDDHLVGSLEAESECGQEAMPRRKGDHADVAVRVNNAGGDLMCVHPASTAWQPVDAGPAILDVDPPRLEHV